MADRDTIAEAKEAFTLCVDAESENRARALEDLRFARLGEQWPEQIRTQRQKDGRPVLTINRMPSFIRQVVNDSRQNRPQIKVKPVDGVADPKTAEVYSMLIRNIETQSKSDIAYDTAVDFAVSSGCGYFRIGVDYAYDDSFDKVITIDQIANPFMIYGDPFSTGADSSDWNLAFLTEYLSKDEFKRKYHDAEAVDWEAGPYQGIEAPWRQDEELLVCEYWTREEVAKQILLMSDGTVVDADVYKANQEYFALTGVSPVNQRQTSSKQVTQRIMTAAEVLSETQWAGKYIPLVPVYGEDINVEGKRYLKSLIHDAKDAQRMFNYWRTTATELVALAPRVPYIGEEGTFDVDPQKWSTVNSTSHAYLEYKKGGQPPQRQMLDSGGAAGAMTEAMAASDDMKAIIGMYDASLGQRSNETSGRAIMARQREGDINTFNFIDNLSRSIRHAGCILIDLIPHVYTPGRIMRVLGEDGSAHQITIGTPPPPAQASPGAAGPAPMAAGQPDGAAAAPPLTRDLSGVYDLGAGKYDVTVDTGPSFTTRREEVALQMTEFLRSFPQAAPVIGDILIKAMDWPQADVIAERLKSMQDGMEKSIELEQAKQKLEAENQALKLNTVIDAQKVEIDRYKAETERMQAVADMQSAEAQAAAAAPMPG